MTPTEAATQLALEHIQAGMPADQAIDHACITLGDDLLDEAQSAAKSVSSAVSPWLWVLSIGGFAMAVMNRSQIQKMYGSWRRMKQALLG